MRKILYLIIFISSNLFSQNFTSYTFTNLVRKNPNFVKNFLEKMDWKQIKNEDVNVLKYYYKNSSEHVQLNANIEIQFNKNEKISSFKMQIENPKIFENYITQLKSNKHIKLVEKNNTKYQFISTDLLYEFILFKESNEKRVVYFVIANRLEKD